MGTSWQGNIVLIGIVMLTVYVVSGAVAEQREAHRLAGLGSCGLAQAYASWRGDFDGAPCGGAADDGAGCEAFVRTNRTFEQAARLVAGQPLPADQASLVDRLGALALQAADGSAAERPSVDGFWDALAIACPPPAISEAQPSD